MTDQEKEIRAEERKIMARIRRVKLERSKKLAAMTDEEYMEYTRKLHEELKADGFNVS